MLTSEVEDDVEGEYCDDLFRACLELDKCFSAINVEAGQHVFVYDTNAINMAPTLVICYLALFLRHKDWDDLPALKKYLRNYNRLEMANLKIAHMVIERNKAF